jgi:hypothetical protein
MYRIPYNITAEVSLCINVDEEYVNTCNYLQYNHQTHLDHDKQYLMKDQTSRQNNIGNLISNCRVNAYNLYRGV